MCKCNGTAEMHQAVLASEVKSPTAAEAAESIGQIPRKISCHEFIKDHVDLIIKTHQVTRKKSTPEALSFNLALEFRNGHYEELFDKVLIDPQITK
jgi:hypothetical protein